MSNDKVLVPRGVLEFWLKLLAPSNEAPDICHGSWDQWELDCADQVEVIHQLLAQPSDGALTNEGTEPVALTAVAVLRDDGDGGLEPNWLLEGGTAELFAGMLLLVADNAPDLCEEDGSAELYRRPLAPPATAPASAELATCTCPSGDGSLRWPCPVHPPEVKALVLPERLQGFPAEHARRSFYAGWNACLDRVKELNS